MKKFFKLFLPLAICFAVIGVTACGSSEVTSAEVEKILEKYDDEGQLSAGEYNKLIDYLNSAIDEVTPVFEQMKKASAKDDYEKVERLNDKLSDLEDKYEYYSKALRIIRHADKEELGSAYSNAKSFLNKERRFEDKY